MLYQIFVYIELRYEERKRLKEGLPDNADLHFRQDLPEKEQQKAFCRADICLGNPPSNWIETDCSLKWLQLESAGFGKYLDIPKNLKLKITNLRGMFGTPVAETAVAGILSLFRGLNKLVLLQENKIWKGIKQRPYLRTVLGSKVIIIGGGSIGSTIKKLLEPFGAEVVVMGKQSPLADIRTISELEKALRLADIVVVALPETPDTIGYFNRKRLDLLSKRAIFVNVGRGSAVDENLLIEKLIKGQIAGAVLDVTAIEPLPPDHALWSCPNTILTQHTGGGYEMEDMDKVTLFLDNFKRFIHGKELLNLVSLEKGY